MSLHGVYVSGAGQSSGDAIAVSGITLAAGVVLFVDSVNGNDANLGGTVTEAKATLAAAHAVASTRGSIIVLLPGHDEVLTSTLTITKAITVIGAGKLGEKPSPRIGFSGAGVQILINFGTAEAKVEFRNVRFGARGDSDTTSRVATDLVNAQSPVFVGCWWECDDDAKGADIQNCDVAVFDDCVWESTGQPTDFGFSADGNGIVYMDNCSFRGPWYNGPYAAEVQNGPVLIEKLDLQYGCSLLMPSSAEGWVHTLSNEGFNYIFWTNDGKYQYSPGLGADEGPLPLTTGAWVTLKPVLYVSSVIGDDAYSGLQRQRPFATLLAAIAAATEYTIIVLAADHDETITAKQTITTETLMIVGEGIDANGEPTAVLRFNGNGASIFPEDYTTFRNVRFAANQQANATSRLSNDSATERIHLYVRDCVFECDQYETVASVQIECTTTPVYPRLRNTKFVSTQTDPALAPVRAVLMGANMYWFIADDVTVDGGTSGFSGHAFELNGAEDFRMVNTKLLNGADIRTESLQAETRSGIIHFSKRTESTYVLSEGPVA